VRGYSDRASVRGWDVGGLPRTGAKRADGYLVPAVPATEIARAPSNS